MNERDRQILWGLGLDPKEQKQILSGAGPGFQLLNFSPEELHKTKELPREQPPAVTWIPLRLWTSLPKRVRQALRKWNQTQRVLIRDNDEKPLTLEDVIEQGFLTVVDKPLTKAKVRGALIKASEVAGLYDDICRMTEEIVLEREMLRRKSVQLEFLSEVLAGTVESMDAAAILAKAENALKVYLPLQAMGAVFLGEPEESDRTVETEIYLPRKLTGPAREEWTTVLLDAGAAVADMPVTGFKIREIGGPDYARARSLKPARGMLSRMPLKAGPDYFGCLVLLTRSRSGLAKDDVRTLHAAVNHLALALKNALVYGKITTRADFDALTRLYCRRFLDERLPKEAERHKRYGLPLSLAMLELDGPGAEGDALGRKARPMVLAHAASLLAKGLRNTDIAARFDENRFAALLPGTNLDQALALAERLRARVEKTPVLVGAKKLALTASIGAAKLDAQAPDPARDLLDRTEKALASAALKGGNIVRIG